MGNRHGILRFDKLTVEKSTYSPNLYLAPHRDKNSRISIILKGELEERTISETIKASVGNLVIKPDNIMHENVFGPGEVTILSVSFHKDMEIPESLRSWQWLKHPKIFVLGMNLWLHLQKVRNDSALDAHFNSFIAEVNTLQLQKDRIGPAWLADVRNSLENNIINPEHIRSLSEKNDLHRVYLARAFKKQYNVSPLEFRKHAKLAALIQELSTTDHSLASIAFDTGFSDQSHMSRTLKKIIGHSPAEFRQLLKKL